MILPQRHVLVGRKMTAFSLWLRPSSAITWSHWSTLLCALHKTTCYFICNKKLNESITGKIAALFFVIHAGGYKFLRSRFRFSSCSLQMMYAVFLSLHIPNLIGFQRLKRLLACLIFTLGSWSNRILYFLKSSSKVNVCMLVFTHSSLFPKPYH